MLFGEPTKVVVRVDNVIFYDALVVGIYSFEEVPGVVYRDVSKQVSLID